MLRGGGGDHLLHRAFPADRRFLVGAVGLNLLERAHAHAVRLGHDRIGGEELLLAVLDDGVGYAVFSSLDISRDVLVWQLEKAATTEAAPPRFRVSRPPPRSPRCRVPARSAW
ncbi:Clp protease N-terminal domain-containing protein [Amycolatopsis thailandensis]|uniref:Clp protease N-terminal domain-containing protein n=1 Tax=Amycolatopsis thailandensis TaxID=589330 RepID=UPI0037A040CC